MPPYVNRVSALVTADTSIVTTAETVLATVGKIDTPGPGMRVDLHGLVQLLVGTGTTGVTLRIRRGTDATGTLIGEANAETAGFTAGSTTAFVIDVVDTPGELAGASYVLTVVQTGASGNGTASQAELEATVH